MLGGRLEWVRWMECGWRGWRRRSHVMGGPGWEGIRRMRGFWYWRWGWRSRRIGSMISGGGIRSIDGYEGWDGHTLDTGSVLSNTRYVC